MKSRIICCLLLAGVMAISGCARLVTRPEKDISTAAGNLLERVYAFNACLTACKGIGTISFPNRTAMPRMRFAWLCSLPDRIRLEILAPTGTPLFTLSADGNYFYILPRTGEGSLHREKAADVNLEKAIAVPLSVSDASHLLAGRIPLSDFDTAERMELANGDYSLRMTCHRPERTENIIFDKTTSRPRKIEFFQGTKGELEYSASFIGARVIGETTIPESIILENGREETVIIAIDRFWPESDVPLEKFILTDTP
jgi:hypothetical protein